MAAIAKPCTGMSARWCPNCGKCACTVTVLVSVNGIDEEVRLWDDDLYHENCPLHATASPHPIKVARRKIVWTKPL